jgi:hypothetical protein
MKEREETEQMPRMATMELAGIKRQSHRRFTVARERWAIRVRSSEWEGEGRPTGLVRSSPLGLTWLVGPGCQPFLFI